MLMRLMSKSKYHIMPKETKFTVFGKLGLNQRFNKFDRVYLIKKHQQFHPISHIWKSTFQVRQIGLQFSMKNPKLHPQTIRYTYVQ